jgi:regulation of enolase protein 1 (concanavalin A-like superfamily)
MISADDAAWIRTLIDHDDQEIDFSFVFNLAGGLEDVLIYKREARNFNSFRP